ncbi:MULTISPECIES: thioredoxin-like domain-containing protein [unclassified Bacteroides]|uniref:thioredoxin-like domain-containing protein n=1 Tax=unclassified Bacteroides TaxID=2646097 RepID=UPI0004E1043E|nr:MULTISPECIES: thioredoxin-like domain-containing protein [unclassified Bacteroides]
MNKKTITTLLLMLTIVSVWAQKVWNNPGYRNTPYGFQFDVNEVEFRPDETVLHITVRNHPNARFSFGKSTVLKTEDDKSYPIISANKTRDGETDLALDKHIPLPESGKTDVALHFQPLPQDVKQFDLIEGYAYNYFKIWDITDPAYKKQALLFNSSWRNVETGEWVISLFNDYAVYDSKVWQYDKKSDKKVVLSSGGEKTAITIGKEKDGKRVFKIGDKKLTLAAITTTSVTDYPVADDTAFSPELKEGNAVVSGWLRYPKEILKNSLTVEVSHGDVAVDDYAHFSTQTDSLGRFELNVPLVGTQGVSLLIRTTGKNEVFDGVSIVLTPGEKYFMLKDFKSSQTLFMGNDARLQNELQAESPSMDYMGYIDNPVSDDSVRVMAKKWINSYERCLAKYKGFLAQHPNMSKRYRDYLSENSRIHACSALLMMHYATYSRVLPADIMQWVEEHSAVDTSLPVNLISGMSSMLRYQRECYIQSDPRIHVLQGEVSALPWLASKGMLQLSDKDNVAISQVEKMRRETYALYSQIKDRRTLRDSINSIQEKYTKYIDAVRKIQESDEYQKAVKTLCAGGEQGIANAIIDSLVTDPLVNSIHHAQILNEYIERERCALPEELEPYIALIKEPLFRDVIIRKNDYYKQVMKEKEEAVNAVIHPSSDVEGLTDGKAIIDKIIEPYRGKIVYLDIWGTWCAPCKRKLSKAHELKAKLKDYDIVYLYLVNRSQEKSWKNVIAEYNLTEPNCVHYNLPTDQQHAVEQYVGLTGYPTYRLFDKHGNMHHLHWLDDENLSEFKKKLDALKE